MSENINSTINGELAFYTASLSPYLQGVEIRQPFQLSSYAQVKIRGNVSFGTTLNRVLQSQEFFNDTLTAQNMGTAGSGSQVNFDSSGTLGIEVIHTIDRRDLGQTLIYNDSTPFEDPDSIFANPKIIITTDPLKLVVATSLVQVCASPSSFDGVIEPFDIRRIIDRTSIEMPYISRSVKAGLSIENVKRENFLQDDKRDLRDTATTPFLDSVSSFGGLDQPGAFSDADQSIAPVAEASDTELFYASGSLDAEIRSVLLAGFTSGSVVYKAARPNCVRPDIIVARHGSDFSQNDNYGYDSIAFGGLLK